MVNKSLIGIVISFLLVGLFVYSMIAFGYTLQTSNANADHNILADPNNAPQTQILNDTFVNLNTNSKEFKTSSNSSLENFIEDDDTSTAGDLLFGSIRNVITVTFKIPTLIYSTVIKLPKEFIFGGDSESQGITFNIIFVTIGTILTFVIIFAGWRTLKTGE